MPKRPDLALVLGVVTLVVIAACVWYPHGFATTPVLEDWLFRRLFEERELGLAMFAARPLVLLSFFVGFALTPDSFVGLGVVFALAFLGRGLALFALLRRVVPEDPSFAIVAAALWLVYPADRGLWNLRFLPYHVATLLLLVAANAAAVLWRRASPFALATLGLAVSASLLTREAGYPLVCVAFLTVTCLALRPGAPCRRVGLGLGLGLFSGLAGMAIVAAQGTMREQRAFGYQRQLLSLDGVGSIAGSFGLAVRRCFFDGWNEAAHGVWHRPKLGLVVWALTIAMSLAAFRRDATPVAETLRRYTRLLLAGLAVVVVGFAPFAVTSLRDNLNRTYFYSSMGAALVVASAIFLATMRMQQPGPSRALIAGTLTALGTIAAANQHEIFVAGSQAQDRVLGAIVAAAPGGLRPGTWVVVLDRDGRGVISAGRDLADALGWVYGSYDIQAVQCVVGAGVSPRRGDQCAFGSTGLIAKPLLGPAVDIPYARVVLFVDGQRPILQQQIPGWLGVTSTDYAPEQLMLSGKAPARSRTLAGSPGS